MAISFEDFQKRIRKNAKKGLYKKPLPAPKPAKKDTIKTQTAPEQIAVNDPIPTVPDTVSPTLVLKADSLIILSEVLFETNSHELRAEHLPTLDSLGKFLKVRPTLEVLVSGHTDSTGSERHNVTLSARRAETVAEYLIDKGAADEKVSFEGFGSSRPLMGNDTPAGRSKNRRVEILIRNPIKK